MPYYFAYGNNMRSATMVDRCGLPTPLVEDGGPAEVETWRDVGIARLRDHRLTFTVTPPNWDGPAGDVAERTDFFVYGFLYEVSDATFAALDGHEYAIGASTLYDRRTMLVERVDPNDLLRTPEVVEAQVYYVAKRDPEQPPDPRYLGRLIEAASQRKLPLDYVRALRSLGRYESESAEGTEQPVDDGQRDGAGQRDRSEQGERLLVLPTKDRGNRNAMPIVQVAPRLKRRLGLGRLAFVILEDRACLASVAERSDLDADELACGLDETIRRGLRVPGIEPGQQFFGARVEVRPARRRMHRGWLSARHLLLNIQKVEYLDAERGIAVVPEPVLRMLGLDHGDYLTIEAVHHHPKSGIITVGRLRRRAFTGSTERRQIGTQVFDYPEEGCLHLDLDSRKSLGFTEDFQPLYPAMVRADRRHLLLKRSLFYSLALIGLSIGLAEAVMPILLPSASPLRHLGAAFGTALILGVAAVWVDLSQRLRP